MRSMQHSAKTELGYSLDDAAAFLEYDRTAVEYWLRMGHLRGQWDSRRSRWTISAQALIDFLKQSNEPMPAGASYRLHQPPVPGARMAPDFSGD